MSLFRFDASFRGELQANWPVLVLAFNCLLFGFSAPAFALPFLFSEVIDEFGWTREQATLLASAKYLTGAVAALVVGRCLDMIGVRAALVAALGIGGIALVSLFFVNGLAVLYLAGVLLGLAGPGAMVAVHAVSPAATIYRTINQLKAVGGEGILVTRIERLMA